MSLKSDQLLLEEVASNLGFEHDDVAAALNEFMLQLYRCIVEHGKPNYGDYIRTRLWTEIQPQAYFGFLGLHARVFKQYGRERDTKHEYIGRLIRPAEWRPFNHQLGGWKESSHYRQGGPEQDEAKDMK